MASAGPAPAARGRRKSLDAELNLVPFIDLLSMCICFLLMTAVWMEIGALNVKQLVGTEAVSSSQASYEMDLKYLNPQRFEVALNYPGKKKESFIVEGATNDLRIEQMRGFFKSLMARLKFDPHRDSRAQMSQAIAVARVTTKAGVSYGEVVNLMDALRDLGIVNLGLVPVRE